jgi:hypothetical protein
MRRKWSTQTMRAAGGAFALCAWLSLAGAARAEQVVLFDVTYTHTPADDATYTILSLAQPASWTAPIDYSQGTVYFHHEVMTKPSAAETLIDVCFDSMRSFGCLETQRYTRTGSFTTMRLMAPDPSWYQREQVDFTRPMRSIQLILKDTAYNHGGLPQTDFLPSRMRFVMTLVSPGGSYRPPSPLPSDAGAAPPDTIVVPEPPPPIPRDAAPAADRPARDLRAPEPPTDASAAPDAAQDTSPPDAATDTAATEPPPSDAAPSAGAGGAGGTGGTGGRGDAMGPRPAPDTTIPGATSSRGCTMTTPPASALPFPWLALATLALARLSRRRA